MNYILLLVGFAVLIKASDLLVDGASSLARRAGMSDYLVGLTVVAFATSLPELIVNMLAVWEGSSGMALGNVVGSNTLNIFVVIGLPAVIMPLVVKGKKLAREIIMTLVLSVLLLVVACDDMFNEGAQNMVTRIDGAILLVLFVLFLIYTFKAAKKPEDGEEEKMVRMSAIRTTIYLVVGILGLFLGGKLIVSSASSIAASLGMSEAVIGLTVVAFGTSLPEIVTSIIAARKISGEMAIGNVLGSNIFNGLFILGLTAVIMPVNAGGGFQQLDLYVTMLGSVILLACVVLWQKVGRGIGAMLLAIYAAYIMYILGIF